MAVLDNHSVEVLLHVFERGLGVIGLEESGRTEVELTFPALVGAVIRGLPVVGGSRWKLRPLEALLHMIIN